MKYNERWIKARNPWLVGIGERDLRGIMIHSTRGGRAAGDDGPGTEGWASNASNSGAFWDMLIFEFTGERVKSCDWANGEYPKWCAGWGDAGTWGGHEHYIQVELGQGTIDDPFDDPQIESLAEFTAVQSLILDFEIVRIPFLTQKGKAPDGICTHEDSANGRKLGKSDPGPLFPWDRYLEMSRSLVEDSGMTRDDVKQICEEVIQNKIRNSELINSAQVPELVAQLLGVMPSTFTLPDDVDLQQKIRGALASGSHTHEAEVVIGPAKPVN